MILIPDPLVYSAMFYLSFIGLICSRRRIVIDPAYFLLFIPQGIMYLLFDVIHVPPIDRAAYVRLSLFLIPFCLSSVMSVYYMRSFK
jgi:hypothetical protein